MERKPRSELPVSVFPRHLKHARYVAALLVVALVVCKRDVLHRRLSSTGTSEEELPPETEQQNGSSFDKDPSGGGGNGGGNNTRFPPVGLALQESLGPVPWLEVDAGETEFEQRQEGGQDNGAVPLCYSSPDANPSEGAWRQSKGGINDSPVVGGGWDLPAAQFDFLHACKRTWRRRHQGGQEPQPYWAWEPTNCALEAVTSEKFCQVMEGRKGLLLVGDSLTRLSTTTLASILRAEPVNVSPLKDEWSACGGRLTVRYMRNDFLDPRTSPFSNVQCMLKSGHAADNTRCTVFGDDKTLKKFDTLVVNSGAHPRPTREEYGQAMRAASESLAAAMRRLHGDDAILVARNTVPGHWGCTERIFDGPANSSVVADLVDSAPPQYKWSTFGDSNALLEEAFSPEGGWRLLDAFAPTILRADAHIGGKDCLHYCLPGPADHWIVLLYNILLASANAQ